MGEVDPGPTRDVEEIPRLENYKSNYSGEENLSGEELGGFRVLDVEMVDRNTHFCCIVGRIRPYLGRRRGADVAPIAWRRSSRSLQTYGQG